jgi:hypothetical protein
MYFVVNATKRNVVLSDIDVSLGPHQGRDLDKLFKRDIIESSKHLSAAIARGMIVVKMKDGDMGYIPTVLPANDNIDVDILQDALKDGIKEGVAEAVKLVKQPPQPSQPGITPEDLQNMLQQLQKTQQAPAQPVQSSLSADDMEKIMGKVVEAIKEQQGNTVIVQDGTQTRQDEEVDIEEDTLVEMHTRVVDRKVKNTDISDVNYEEKEVKEDGFDENLDELEDLLG